MNLGKPGNLTSQHPETALQEILQVYIDHSCLFLIVSSKKIGGNPPSTTSLPWRQATPTQSQATACYFFLFPPPKNFRVQSAFNFLKQKRDSSCPLEFWACYVGPSVTSDTRERWAGFFCVCDLASNPKQQQNKPNPIFFLFHRQIVTGISYRWNSDKWYNGWPIGNRPTTD